MGMTHRIWVSAQPENHPIWEICGFHGWREFCIKTEPFINATLITFTDLFAKSSKCFVHDCLRNHKMAFFSKLVSQQRNLLLFS